jgi:hypothetical protein
MTYTCNLDWFERTDTLEPYVDTDSDYIERLEEAQFVLDEITDADIEEFDVHDAIRTIASHYGVVESDLLEHYDERQIILSYR